MNPTPFTTPVLLERGILRFCGADARGFLQGLISNDIGLLAPQAPLYAALLTPQGKFLHDFFLHEVEEAILLEAETARLNELMQKLKTYRLRARVEMEDISGSFRVVALPAGGLPADPRLPELGGRQIVRIIESPANATADRHAYDLWRLSLGVPDGSREAEIGKDTLADLNIDILNGVSWTKGCYVGQELTARMHHRALVKKRLFPLRIEGTAPTERTAITADKTVVGELRSAIADRGLALLSIDAVQKSLSGGPGLMCGGATLHPTIPHWLDLKA